MNSFDNNDLALINQLAKSQLSDDQIYTFSVRLCDNEVDRDFERFRGEDLDDLGNLMLGKAGIFDHQWSAENQTARIYRTEVVRESAVLTAAGDPYCWLKGWAYMLRSEKNADLIREIEAGIKKEVSVGCSMARSVCSICGDVSGCCEHVKGQSYQGRLCFRELQGPLDAYEWSFVAVPAQRNAGILKRFGQCRDSDLQKQAQLGRSFLNELRRDTLRFALLADDGLDAPAFETALRQLDGDALMGLRDAFRKRAALRFPAHPQLPRGKTDSPAENTDAFRV